MGKLTADPYYVKQAEELTKKYLANSNCKFVYIEDITDDNQLCYVLQIVKK